MSVTTPSPACGFPNGESSSTDESCGAYIARKWEQLGVCNETCNHSQGDGNAGKASCSFALELMPNQDPSEQEENNSDSVPGVSFLDPPTFPVKSNLKSMYRPPKANVQKLCVKIGDTGKELLVSEGDSEGLSNSEGCSESAHEFGMTGSECAVPRAFSNRSASDTGQESAGLAGSTVADALYAPVHKSWFNVSDTGSVTSVDFPEVTTRVPQLCASSLALI